MAGPIVREVVSTPGFAAWAVTTLGARLPITMAPLLLVLMGAGATGSLAIGGLLVAIHTVGEVIGSPLMGRLMDAWPSRTFVALILGLQVAGFLAVAYFIAGEPNLPAVYVAVFLVGVVPAGVPGSLRSTLARLLPEHRRPMAFSIDNVLNQSCWAASPVVVGVIATLAEPWVLPVLAAIPAFVGALAALALSGGEASEDGEDSGGSMWAILRRIRGPIVLSVILRIALGMLSVAAAAFAAVLGNASLAGLALGCYAIATGTSSLLFGPKLSWPGRAETTSVLGLGILGLALTAAIFLTGSAAGLLLLYSVVGFVEGPVMVSLMCRIQRSVPVRRATTAFSIQYAAVGVGFAIGSTTFVPLAEALSNGAAVSLAGGAIAVLAVVAALVVRGRPREA